MSASLTAARSFLEDPYFKSLVEDLDKGTRKRKIKRAEYELVKEVSRLPEYPRDEPGLSKEEQVLAKEQATFILDAVALGDLKYDSDARAHFVRG